MVHPQTTAFLDKSEVRVLCACCRKRIAYISEASYPPDYVKEGISAPDSCRRVYLPHRAYYRVVKDGTGYAYPLNRTVVLPWAYRLHSDGIWRLSERAKKRLGSGKLPSVRRQNRVNRVHDLGHPIQANTPIESGTSRKDLPRENAQAVHLPIRLQCFWCASVQTLDAEILRVTSADLGMGTDVGDWRSHFWFDDELPITQVWHDDGRPITCIRCWPFEKNGRRGYSVESAT